MSEHIRVALHAPGGKLSQDNLDTILDVIKNQALRLNKGNKPIFMMIDSHKVREGERVSGDDTMDFVVRLHLEQIGSNLV